MVALLVLWAAGCVTEEAPPPGPSPTGADINAFAEQAQPAMARSCAFPACHGTEAHGLSLYAVGRRRLIEEPNLDQMQFAPLTVDELEQNLESCLRFVDVDDPEGSDLLVRTLPISAGGRGHGGGALYLTKEDPEYQDLLLWIRDEVVR